MRRPIIILVASTLGAFALAQTVDAGQIRVSEDNAGDGVFVVQGFVETFDQTSNTAANVYKNRTTCTVSYGGTVFVPQVDKTTLAVIDTSPILSGPSGTNVHPSANVVTSVVTCTWARLSSTLSSYFACENT